MRTMSFDLEEKRMKEEIKKRKPKIVFLQLPEGLKPEAPRLLRKPGLYQLSHLIHVTAPAT